MTRPFESLMLRTMLGPLVASLQLFGLYVLIHGHYSPGGGFQAGVLLASSLILPRLVHGRAPWRRVLTITERGATAMSAIGVLIFAAFGVAPILFGGTMLDYAALPFGDMADAYRRTYAILGIEIGVTLGVAGAAVAIFYALYDFEQENA